MPRAMPEFARIPRMVIRLATTAALMFVVPSTPLARAQDLDAETGHREVLQMRLDLATAGAHGAYAHVGSMSPADRRLALDAYWGPGPSTAVKLATFDKFWTYADQHFAAFQGIAVDWASLRDRYRPEVAAGVSRGRFAAIINHMSLALRESHTQPMDLLVNAYTVPAPGVPLLAVGAWTFDTVGACLTAQDDGSALVYSALPGHPLGLEPGDRILGYDGIPWREQYQSLLREELPLWPLWWGSSPSSFDRSFVMAAGTNWHLFDTMDIAKHKTGQVVHMPTSLMPGVMWYGFCSEQLSVAGVAKPGYYGNDYVSWGIVDGTRVGYIYVWGWFDTAEEEFMQAVRELTQIARVNGLIIDLRFNSGGFLRAPFRGLGVLFEHPVPTMGLDDRKRPDDHLKMQSLVPPSAFKVDFEDVNQGRVKLGYDGPIAVLLGPGALSAGDFSSFWLTFHPRVHTFGRATASAFNLPTQPALGTSLDLGPGWFARVAEANAYEVGAPSDFLTHRELTVDEPVWLTAEDVALGKDTVVNAALRWIANQLP